MQIINLNKQVPVKRENNQRAMVAEARSLGKLKVQNLGFRTGQGWKLMSFTNY